MVFNEDKLAWLQFGHNIYIYNDYNYTTDNIDDILVPEETAKDLGITISCDGSYRHHIENIIKKANQKIGLLLRSFNSRDPALMRLCWRTYVLPAIDYCSQLWAPCEGPQLYKLEAMQSAFTAKITGLQSTNYWIAY